MCALVNLDAVQAHDEISAAFNGGWIEIDIAGDLEDVEIDLGIRTEHDTPQPRYNARETPTHMYPGDVVEEHAFRTLFGSADGIENETSMPIVRTGSKVDRNDPCPCGSDRKYKRCCF